MWVYIARLILKNRVFWLSLIGVITILMGYEASKVEMSYKYSALLPRNDSVYIQNAEFEKIFGDKDNMMVLGVQHQNFFDIGFFNAFRKMEKSLVSLNGIKKTFSAPSSFLLSKNSSIGKFEFIPSFPDSIATQFALDSLKERFFQQDFYRNVIYNPNEEVYVMSIVLDREILFSKEREGLIDQILTIVNTFEQSQQVKCHMSGLPYIRVRMAKMVKKELNMFLLLALLVTATIMFLFFRSFKVVMISLLVVGIAVIWAVGMMGLMGYKITMITGMIPPLLIVIGIPNAVFLLNKYHSEYRGHGNKIKALQRVIRKIGNATFLTNLTTASGFATFILTRSPILVEFGILSSINIVVLYFLSILLIPIIYSFLDDPKERHVKHLDNNWTTALVDKLIYIVVHQRRAVYILTFLIVIFGVYGTTKMYISGYMVDDLPQHNSVCQDLNFFEKHLNGIMPLEILIDTKKGNGVMRTSTLQKIDLLEAKLDSFEELSKPMSIVDGMKIARQAYYNGNPDYFSLPTAQERNFILRYVPKTTDEQSSGLMQNFVDSLRQKTRISLQVADIGVTRMDKLTSEIEAITDSIFTKDKYIVSITGGSVVHQKGTSYLVRNLFTSLGVAILIIALFMALMFSSKRMVLVALIPNMIPLLITAAIMGIFGIPLKASTILVFSIALGISVDDTIHYLAKYRQELADTNWSIKTSVVLALKETGVSMIYTSIILFFGFGIFSISSFGGTSALGILISITLLMAMFVNLILLPTLLMSLDKAITNRAFKEPLLDIYDEEGDIDLDELKIEKGRF